MVFSSTVFLFLFLPITFILHSIVPEKKTHIRNLILSAASLVFYAFGEPVYIIIMIASVAFNYFLAILVDKASDKKRSALCGFTIAVDVAVLCFFKYVHWIVGVVNDSFGLALPSPDVTIPVGISFYTFQILSYVADVCSRKTEVQRSFGDLLLYISFFPQLIAGPIVKYGDIKAQLNFRHTTTPKLAYGVRRFTIGLSKKVIISNTAAILSKAAFDSADPSSLLCLVGAIAYSLQLYYDFSGYSDMAIGLGQLFGFDFIENFDAPYSAITIRDFWKRWHISLTSWFREYVYIPLGGNRKGKFRTIVNRLIVFFLTGLWHGANFTFIVWGMWHGILMMLEQILGFDRLAKNRALTPIFRIYTLTNVVLSFVVFNSPSVSFAFSYIGKIFSFSGNYSDVSGLFSPFVCIVMSLAIIFSFFSREEFRKLERYPLCEMLSYLIVIPLLLLNIMSLASGGFNPFIYYTF